jgi:hypothetical protein
VSTAPADAQKRSTSHATKLVNLVSKSGAELFHSPDGLPFATVKVADHHATMSLNGAAFREWLMREYFLATHKAASASAIKDACGVLAGSARLHGPEYPVFIRLARVGDTIWLDLGGAAWDAIKITAEGWRTARTLAGCPGRIPHDFRRTTVRRLEQAGVSRSVAMKLTGHKTEAIYRRYAIVSAGDLREAVQRLNGYTSGDTQQLQRRSAGQR